MRIFAALCLSLAPALGQEVEGSIPVSVIEGRLVVACDLSTPTRRIPVNLLVEFGQPHGLILHNKAAAPLACELPDGTTVPIRIHLPEFDLEVERRELGDEEFFEHFTKYHSTELGENALVGSIGYEVLSKHRVIFDLARGALGLAPLGDAPTAPVRPEKQGDGAWTLPLLEHAGLLWLSVTGKDGQPFGLAVGGGRSDTLVDQLLCEQWGVPDGDLGPILLGDIDLGLFIAPRPEPLALVHPSTPLGVIGSGLLQHLVLDLDRRAQVARVRVSRPPLFPEADRAFFRARLRQDAGAMEGFLEQWPEARLAKEAAELLLALRFDEFAGAEETMRALSWIVRTSAKDLATTRLLDLMVVLGDEGRQDEVLAAGSLAIEAGRKDRYPNAVHEVHGRMGRELLRRGEGREAWRHLLSASFGLPEDGRINLDLGRYYEGEGRLRRAFARFVQAVLSPDSGPEALLGMARVQAALGEDEPFGVELVDRLTQGKVRNFGSATKFEEDPEHPVQGSVLLEFFTNSWQGDGDAGAIGGALAFEGLLGHFAEAPVVLLSHHLPEPRLDSLCTSFASTRAARHGLGPGIVLLGGRTTGPGAARHYQAPEVFEALRARVSAMLQEESPYDLALEGSIEGDTLRARLEVFGPTEADRDLIIVLVEKGVLFPGKTGVIIHRHLVRAELTSGGVEWNPEAGSQVHEVEASLAGLESAHLAHLADLEARGIGITARVSTAFDQAQLALAAWVEDRGSGAVLGSVFQDLGKGERP